MLLRKLIQSLTRLRSKFASSKANVIGILVPEKVFFSILLHMSVVAILVTYESGNIFQMFYSKESLHEI